MIVNNQRALTNTMILGNGWTLDVCGEAFMGCFDENDNVVWVISVCYSSIGLHSYLDEMEKNLVTKPPR